MRRVVGRLAAALLVLGIGVVAWHPSYARFSRTTSTSGNSWAGGSVQLSANPATAVFAVTGAIPGSTGSGCVKVTYSGTLPALVRLYLTAGNLGGTGLASYLTLQIVEGTGNDSTCGDFSQTAVDYNTTGLTDTTKTLAAFSAAASDYATGVSSWSATTGQTKTYRFNWQLQGDNAARGLTATATFTWEAQNT